MQKLIILLFIVLTMPYAQAQCPPVIIDGKLHGLLPVIDQKVNYCTVVECGSVTQLDLFRRARLALIQSATAADPLVLSDKETGDLMRQETIEIRLPRSDDFAGRVHRLRYGLLVECANRKYRATITQIHVVDPSTHQSVPIETYCLASEKEARLFYGELDKQLTRQMTQFQTAVTTYQPF